MQSPRPAARADGATEQRTQVPLRSIPVRARCVGEKVFGNPARGRPRAAGAVPGISLRSLETARISFISNPGAWEPAFHSRAKANKVAG